MNPSRTVLCRSLLEKTKESVKILGVDPEQGLLGLNNCVSLIMQIYESFDEEPQTEKLKLLKRKWTK